VAGDNARLRGLSAARRKLREAADRIAGVTEAAISDFADDVVVHMKGIVPVDTGELKGSIKKEKQGKGYTVGPRGVDYAEFVENGTSRSPAQPYVAPTIQWAKANGPKRIARRIKGEISE
jgi:HK97 gp10 family phage protein